MKTKSCVLARRFFIDQSGAVVVAINAGFVGFDSGLKRRIGIEGGQVENDTVLRRLDLEDDALQAGRGHAALKGFCDSNIIGPGGDGLRQLIVGEQLPDAVLFVRLLSEAWVAADSKGLGQFGRDGLEALAALDLLVMATAALPVGDGLNELTVNHHQVVLVQCIIPVL